MYVNQGNKLIISLLILGNKYSKHLYPLLQVPFNGYDEKVDYSANSNQNKELLATQ